MQWFKTKQYYVVASLLVLVITYIVFIGFDAIFATQSDPKVLQQVYLAPVGEVPVLKSLLEYDAVIDATESGDALLQNQPEFSISNSLTARSAYVVDVDSDTVLFDRNSQRILLPASTTKLMTALIVLEAYDNDISQEVVIPQLPSIDGLRYEFPVGSSFTVGDLLKAMLIQSNNDAAYILAIQSPLGIQGFVDRMNHRAQELQLSSTYFENPAGFDAEGQRSTARDLVVLTKAFMQDEFLKSIVATAQTSITDISGTYEFYLESTHQLLYTDPTVVGVKTGTTEGAAQVLITQFNRENHNIVIVIMGSDDRYLETNQLIDWVLNSYEWIRIEELMQAEN